MDRRGPSLSNLYRLPVGRHAFPEYPLHTTPVDSLHIHDAQGEMDRFMAFPSQARTGEASGKGDCLAFLPARLQTDLLIADG